ncbi:hypothetical protein [Luteibacter yeojuensis]|uniref:Uncharacterized protein n=1 Tax=Luteibacter yeojuensis TaxID=345309 RepID=A0A7X5QTG3_9GAMM|nr:hypothetical protein [Luteibacter yeojuensis]NID15000.1 hypothetical protein [Luteibacter yeojuensis]
MSRYSDAEYEAAIEEMMDQPRYIADFIFDGAETEELVRLLLSRGLPFRDGTARDGRLLDRYNEQIDALKAAFTTFAHEGKTAKHASRVDAFLDYQRQQMEDAA